MVKTRKKRTGSAAIGIAVGIAAALTVSIAGAALTAWLISAETIRQGSGTLSAAIIHFFAALSGAVAAGTAAKEKRLPVIGAVTGGYFLLLLTVTVLVFGGEFEGFLLGLAATALGGGAVAFFAVKGKKKGHAHSRRRKYR